MIDVHERYLQAREPVNPDDANPVEAGGQVDQRLALYAAVVEHARDAILITDGACHDDDPRILYVNPAFTKMTGYAPDEVVGRSPKLLQGAKTDPAERKRIRDALQRGEPVRAELVNYTKDGRAYLIEIDISPVMGARGEVTHFISIQRDITSQRAEADRLRRFRDFRRSLAHVADQALKGPLDASFLSEILAYAVDAVPGVDAGSLSVREHSGDFAFAAVHGFPASLKEVRLPSAFVMSLLDGTNPVVIDGYADLGQVDPDIAAALSGPSGRANDVRATLKVPIWIEGELRAVFNLDALESEQPFDEDAVEMGRLFGRQVGTILQRLDLQNLMQEQASTDALTGLPNRLVGEQDLASLLERSRTQGIPAACLLLDIDNFQLVNDAYGHAFGDALIRACSDRLQAVVGPRGTIVRWTGDEFMVMVHDLAGAGPIEHLAHDIFRRFDEGFSIAGTSAKVSLSIGGISLPENGSDLERAIHNAHIALFEAKRRQPGTFVHYSDTMRDAITRRTKIEHALRDAIAADRIELAYQPRVDLRTERVTSVEALARWTDPELGVVSPAEFVPIAEDSDLIYDLGQNVLDRACGQAKAWLDEGRPCVVAVNLSLKELRHGRIVEDLCGILGRHGLNGQWLELEITESAAMSDVEATIDTLTRLRKLGVTVSIDDFGTAYSSLAHLKLLPIDALKIDRSFVTDLPDTPDDAPTEVAIIQAIIALGKSMNLKVIAEGVETMAQKRFLKLLGCDEAQGYFFGRPVPAAQLNEGDRQPIGHGGPTG